MKPIKFSVVLTIFRICLMRFIFNSDSLNKNNYIDYKKLSGTYCTHDPGKYNPDNIYIVFDDKGYYTLYVQHDTLDEGFYFNDITSKTISLANHYILTYNDNYSELILLYNDDTLIFNKYSDVLLYINVQSGSQ